MAKHIEQEIVYYYDFHPTSEDLMGETSVHAYLVHYLMDVLTWLFQGQQCAVYENLNFYQTANRNEYPLAPDIAVIKGVDFHHVRSWSISKTGLAPQVVFEIASEETWRKDLAEKPRKYALMGVEEYIAYDPNEPLIGKRNARRLFGWSRDPHTGEMQEMLVHLNGHLWSAQLDSFLVPDRQYLRLYDAQGHLRLTQAEAEIGRTKAEVRRTEAEARRAETEKRRAEAEARRAEALAEKLRSLGIDPDKI